MRKALANSRLILAVLLVIAIHSLLRLAIHQGGNVISGDFAAYLTGAHIVRDGQIDALYDVTIQRPVARSMFENPPDDWFNPYIAPPFVAYAYLPLALVPYTVAAEIFFALTILLIVASVRLLWPLLPKLQSRVRQSEVLLVALVSAPGWYLLIGGQNTAIVMFLMVAGLVLLRGQREIPAGIVLGLGVFKPQLFILIPVVLVMHRRWRALAAWAGTSVTLGVLSIMAVGVSGMRSYLEFLTGDDYVGDVASERSWKMISLVSEVRYLGSGIEVPGNIAWLLAMLPLALTPLILWKVRGNLQQSFALAILLTMVFNPHIFYYDLLLLLIPALVLLNARPDSHVVRGALASVFVLSWLMEPLHAAFGDQGWPLFLLSTHWLPVPMLVLTVIMIRQMWSEGSVLPVRRRGQAGTPETDPFPALKGGSILKHNESGLLES